MAAESQIVESRFLKTRRARYRALIITADHFGLHSRVNLAVERAHRHGVFTAANLMIGARCGRRSRARPRVAAFACGSAPGARGR